MSQAKQDIHAPRYTWATSGDWSAFLGLTFDNVAQLIVFSSILITVFQFPSELVLRRMLPGTAFGVLVGDLIYTWLAFRLARRTARSDVTAMPLGIDTVSLFGLTFGVLGPLHLQTRDAEQVLRVGMALMVIMGLFKIAVSWSAARLRQIVPPAAMLGTIGAVGILLIAFLPTLTLFSTPLVGIPALFLILAALLRGVRLPGNFPVVLAIVAGTAALFYLLQHFGLVLEEAMGDFSQTYLGLTLPFPTVAFARDLKIALSYLPIALPLAFVTVIGGIDNTASAAAAGDEYETRSILLTEGISTLIAGLVGGVIQTTPYIGHPAYKRMGGRAAYTLATALFVGLGGIFGYLAMIVHWLPEVVVVPILVFIGLEITAQAFRSVPERHAPAVAACFIPVIANLILILASQLLSGAGSSPDLLQGKAAASFSAIRLLANGFVFSSLLMGAATAFIIDGRWRAAAGAMVVSSVASLFGLIHSPLPGAAVFLPWQAASPLSYHLAVGYAATAILILCLEKLPTRSGG